MTTYRPTTADIDAVQFTDAPDAGPVFSETPDWLTLALEQGDIALHPKEIGDQPHLNVRTGSGTVLASLTDWIAQVRPGTLIVIGDIGLKAGYVAVTETTPKGAAA